MKIIAKLLVTTLALLATAKLVPGFVVDGFYFAIIIALIFGLVNLTIKPILTLLTLPIQLITLGLFSFIINALLLWFVSSFISGFYISSFSVALIGSLIVSLITYVGNKFVEIID